MIEHIKDQTDHLVGDLQDCFHTLFDLVNSLQVLRTEKLDPIEATQMRDLNQDAQALMNEVFSFLNTYDFNFGENNAEELDVIEKWESDI